MDSANPLWDAAPQEDHKRRPSLHDHGPANLMRGDVLSCCSEEAPQRKRRRPRAHEAKGGDRTTSRRKICESGEGCDGSGIQSDPSTDAAPFRSRPAQDGFRCNAQHATGAAIAPEDGHAAPQAEGLLPTELAPFVALVAMSRHLQFAGMTAARICNRLAAMLDLQDCDAGSVHRLRGAARKRRGTG